MDDLIERLRAWADGTNDDYLKLALEAADALEHWRGEADRLSILVQEALQLEIALRAEVERLKLSLDNHIRENIRLGKVCAAYSAEVERLKDENAGFIEPLQAEVARLRGALEGIANMVEQSEVFCEHGCTDRIAALIRGESCDDGSKS